MTKHVGKFLYTLDTHNYVGPFENLAAMRTWVSRVNRADGTWEPTRVAPPIRTLVLSPDEAV